MANMQQRFNRVGIAITAVLITATAPAAAADLSEYANEVFQSLMMEHDIPGLAVAVVLRGETHFFNYGISSRSTGAEVDQNTIFEVGSISKIFTAALGAHAVSTGTMNLEDRPSQYLDWLAGTAADRASLLNLVTYTAGGLPLQFAEGVSNDEDIKAYFTGWMPDAAPGVRRRYSNPSIGLFGRVTAAALGDDFGQLVERHVIQPIGLESTYVDVPEEAMSRYAWGHRDGTEVRANPGPLDTEAYGIKSTTADLALLVQANIDSADLEPRMREAIEATQVGYFRVGPMVQGLGWEQYPFPVDLNRLVSGNSPAISGEANPVEAIDPPAIPRSRRCSTRRGRRWGSGAMWRSCLHTVSVSSCSPTATTQMPLASRLPIRS